jgi:hypothetical protein
VTWPLRERGLGAVTRKATFNYGQQQCGHQEFDMTLLAATGAAQGAVTHGRRRRGRQSGDTICEYIFEMIALSAAQVKVSRSRPVQFAGTKPCALARR